MGSSPSAASSTSVTSAVRAGWGRSKPTAKNVGMNHRFMLFLHLYIQQLELLRKLQGKPVSVKFNLNPPFVPLIPDATL